jgi:hypothetical protein
MMARSLVDLIESKDAGMPVQSINFMGVRHSKYSVPTLAVTIT